LKLHPVLGDYHDQISSADPVLPLLRLKGLRTENQSAFSRTEGAVAERRNAEATKAQKTKKQAVPVYG
jgi:hypothetical protein